MKIIPALFEEREIRRLYDEKTETWFFSVVDIIQAVGGALCPDFGCMGKMWYANRGVKPLLQPCGLPARTVRRPPLQNFHTVADLKTAPTSGRQPRTHCA